MRAQTIVIAEVGLSVKVKTIVSKVGGNEYKFNGIFLGTLTGISIQFVLKNPDISWIAIGTLTGVLIGSVIDFKNKRRKQK
ncbi:hypothetical protein [Streptococcus merionis]|uniref:Uncharacterized protein n=1 Tax=Streptococcus merionis TaxID=400065 RepID=A0A239SN78_9STRE|nr:hypothetical protein [Streptococcus merionis]SNU86204.1 Uncharacterised protein [Streptococcus merionis]